MIRKFLAPVPGQRLIAAVCPPSAWHYLLSNQVALVARRRFHVPTTNVAKQDALPMRAIAACLSDSMRCRRDGSFVVRRTRDAAERLAILR
jgi:hypothetical protein